MSKIATIKRDGKGGWIISWPTGAVTRTATFAEARDEVHYAQRLLDEQRGEIEAERAWLRAADPQSGY